MNNPYKIQKLLNLADSDVCTLLVNILKLKGFSDVNQVEDLVITGSQKALINNTSSIFITFPSKLGGTGNVDNIKISNFISETKDKYSSDSVYVFSKHTISNGVKNSLKKSLPSIAINYIDRDAFISLIDEVFPEYWRHDDVELINYEKELLANISQDSDWKKLRFPTEKYAKLLDIFIEPRMVRCYQDKQTNTPLTKHYSISELISYQSPVVIDGNAGAGKSTLLKRIVKILIDDNSTSLEKKHLPVFLTALDVHTANYDIQFAIQNKLLKISEAPLSELTSEYDIQVILDSIDEFSDKISGIINELNRLNRTYGIKYYIATRNSDGLIEKSDTPLDNFSIRRFNIEQIRLFLQAFFSGDEGKTSHLLDALKDNQMIERLPMTPLTLSLISILFEETEFEIPATISDIYDNFNTLIIGKSVVSSKIEFIDISFKERILSLYAYTLLETPGHIPMSYPDFVNFFKDYYEGKTIPIKNGTIEEVLDFLIQNTGILFLKDGTHVQFTHDSYMEYYAALELFKHRRADEQLLIDNFFDPNWQNTAIFYAGESKDMPEFLGKIKEKLSKAGILADYMSGICGAGFILQALYQTDNSIRRDVILEALKLSLLNLDLFKVMAADEVIMFKDYKLPILNLINFIYFYESFNSITLAQPLQMAFESKLLDYKKTFNPADGYNLIELAFTLDSKRIGIQEPLSKVIDIPEIIREPNLNLLASLSVDLLGKEKYKDFRAILKKAQYQLSDISQRLIDEPVRKLRFTPIDTIRRQTKVSLFVEGKTDAEILEFAYMMLTDGAMPYWTVNKAGHNALESSAKEVAKTLTQAYPMWEKEQTSLFIGLFDHDNAGLASYRALSDDFIEISKDSIKKHKDADIYAICIPVPGEMENYLFADQQYNYFEIEHYFGYDYLKSKQMLMDTPITGIYKIKDGPKTQFAHDIRKETNPDIFKHFLLLFSVIDDITGMTVKYVLD